MRIQILVLSLATLITGVAQSDPFIIFKNNSDRAVHIQPFTNAGTFPAKRIKAGSEARYNAPDGGKSTIDGIRVKYCSRSNQNYKACNTDGNMLSTWGTVYEFRFTPAKTKYYLKLTIDQKSEKPSLRPQEGRAGRTSNWKWSLADNVKATDIKGPISAAPTGTPPALPQSAQKQRTSMKAEPIIPAMDDEGAEEDSSDDDDDLDTILKKIDAPATRPASLKKPIAVKGDDIVDMAWARFPEADNFRRAKSESWARDWAEKINRANGTIDSDSAELARLVLDIANLGIATWQEFILAVPTADQLATRKTRGISVSDEERIAISCIIKSAYNVLEKYLKDSEHAKKASPKVPKQPIDEDIAITLMPETLEQKTIVPARTQSMSKGQYEDELRNILGREDAYIAGLEYMIRHNQFDEDALSSTIFNKAMNQPIAELMKRKPTFNAVENELGRQHTANYQKADNLRVKARKLAGNKGSNK